MWNLPKLGNPVHIIDVKQRTKEEWNSFQPSKKQKRIICQLHLFAKDVKSWWYFSGPFVFKSHLLNAKQLCGSELGETIKRHIKPHGSHWKYHIQLNEMVLNCQFFFVIITAKAKSRYSPFLFKLQNTEVQKIRFANTVLVKAVESSIFLQWLYHHHHHHHIVMLCFGVLIFLLLLIMSWRYINRMCLNTKRLLPMRHFAMNWK